MNTLSDEASDATRYAKTMYTITLRHPFALAADAAITQREEVKLALAFDSNAAMLIVPSIVSEQLGLPIVRRQALHEAALNATGERKPVLAVELEINGTRAIFEAVVEPNISTVIVSPALMDSLALERKN